MSIKDINQILNEDFEGNARRWVFTMFNYDDDDELDLQGYVCKFLLYGRETCPTTGKKHLQGYFHFENQKEFKTLKKAFPKAWLKPARGTGVQNVQYCSKGGDIFRKGSFVSQGQRKDIEAIYEMIRSGSSIFDVMDTHPNKFLKFHSGIEKMWNLNHQSYKRVGLKVYWIFGPTGVGKTGRVDSLIPSDKLYWKDNTKWWNNYKGQEYVLIDDFDGPKWNVRDLLRILDIYSVTGEVKCGYVGLTYTTVFITCDSHPDDVFENETCQVVSQIRRRISHIIYIGSKSSDVDLGNICQIHF